MEDDTGRAFSPLGIGPIEQAKALWKFRINREEAQEWASQDIQFLVYDDTDEPTCQKAQLAGTDGEDAQLTGIGDENADGDRPRSSDSGPSSQPPTTESRSAPGFADSSEDAAMQRAIWESLNGAQNAHQSRASADVTEVGAPDGATGTVHPEADTSDPETDEEELQEAIRLSLESDEVEENNLPQASPRSESPHRSKKTQCRICSAVPPFPHDRKTRKFRVFRPSKELTGDKGAVGLCLHYVAVSYCWPEPARDTHGNMIPAVINSQVRDLDGKQRRARALDHVLDAAVDFANSCGLRMIWIDQECLPQPQPGDTPSEEDVRYKQLGVQAMDSVYNKAMVTLGLHAYKVTSQLQADAIRVWRQYAENRGPLVPNGDMVNGLLDFLDGVRLDRWYTRAWVVQEAISSGRKLFLAFPKAAEVSHPSPKYRKEHGQFASPPHPLDTGERVLDSELIAMPVGDFHDIVGAARALLGQRLRFNTGQALPFRPDVAFPILEAAERLHPKISTQQDPGNVSMVSSRVYGSRPRADAATAVTLLSRRSCRDVQDRVTILANMCDYEIRLNTDDVGRHCKSLQVGYLAVALLNGDLSLLVPEVFRPLRDGPEIGLPTEGSRMRSLLSPFDTDARLLDHTMFKEGSLVMPRLLIHAYDENQREGLRFPADRWTVDSMLDLRILQYEYAELWQSIKTVHIAICRAEQESDADFKARNAAFGRHFGTKAMTDAAKRELLDHATIAPGSPLWGGLDSTGVRIRAFLSAVQVERSAALQDIVARIVFAILRYLHSLSTPQSIGVANSIWQSLRVAVVEPYGNGTIHLPDTVGDELFTHPDVVKAPFHTLQLDKSRDGSYHQVWLIDRIMHQGCLWTGTYRHAGLEPGPSPSASGGSDAAKFGKTILEKQLRRCTLATLTRTVSRDERRLSNETNVNSGSLTYLCEALMPGSCFSAEAELVRREERVAAFDVDGPCIVATPMNHDWEVLPRPALRSMSVCWVVERVKKLELHDGPAQSDSGEGGPTQASRKGKEPATARDMVDTGDAATPGDGQPSARTRTEDEDTLFRVVDKVKGVWQIMDPSFRLYSFC